MVAKGANKGLAKSFHSAGVSVPQGECEAKMPRRAFTPVTLPRQMPTVQIREVPSLLVVGWPVGNGDSR